MPDNTKERLEREARESLVASDLSAKMKQWRDNLRLRRGEGLTVPRCASWSCCSPSGERPGFFWPQAGKVEHTPLRQEQPAESPALEPPPTAPPPGQAPIAQKSAPAVNRYAVLAQSNYRAPDFVAEIRGGAPASQDALNAARRALAERRYADALRALQNVTADYQPDADYLRGHALFGLKEYMEAAAVFGQLTGSIRYGEAAQWYEVLALLSDYEHTKRAVLKKLKSIAESEGHAFQREAAQLNQLL